MVADCFINPLDFSLTLGPMPSSLTSPYSHGEGSGGTKLTDQLPNKRACTLTL